MLDWWEADFEILPQNPNVAPIKNEIQFFKNVVGLLLIFA